MYELGRPGHRVTTNILPHMSNWRPNMDQPVDLGVRLLSKPIIDLKTGVILRHAVTYSTFFRIERIQINMEEFNICQHRFCSFKRKHSIGKRKKFHHPEWGITQPHRGFVCVCQTCTCVCVCVCQNCTWCPPLFMDLGIVQPKHTERWITIKLYRLVGTFLSWWLLVIHGPVVNLLVPWSVTYHKWLRLLVMYGGLRWLYSDITMMLYHHFFGSDAIGT